MLAMSKSATVFVNYLASAYVFSSSHLRANPLVLFCKDGIQEEVLERAEEEEGCAFERKDK